MTTATLEPRPGSAPLTLERVRFADIPRGDWERLYAATPHATPFASWTFHRAWWDAYAEAAADHYLVSDPLRAIVPLMLRDVPGEGRSLFMGASYHADYATILAAPADLPATAAALASTIVPRRRCRARLGRRLHRPAPPSDDRSGASPAPRCLPGRGRRSRVAGRASPGRRLPGPVDRQRLGGPARIDVTRGPT